MTRFATTQLKMAPTSTSEERQEGACHPPTRTSEALPG